MQRRKWLKHKKFPHHKAQIFSHPKRPPRFGRGPYYIWLPITIDRDTP